jgi:hypothetical protein
MCDTCGKYDACTERFVVGDIVKHKYGEADEWGTVVVTDPFTGFTVEWPDQSWTYSWSEPYVSLTNRPNVKPKETRVKAETRETRVVDPVTGGEKGAKDLELGFIDPLALEELGRVASLGTKKYDPFNYVKGYSWMLSVNALFRHLLAFLRGEDRDPETGCLHVTHVAWHGLALTSFALRKVGTDDRVARTDSRQTEA